MVLPQRQVWLSETAAREKPSSAHVSIQAWRGLVPKRTMSASKLRSTLVSALRVTGAVVQPSSSQGWPAGEGS